MDKNNYTIYKVKNSLGIILMIHGSAAFNINGRIPLDIDSKYAKIEFYKELSDKLNSLGWDCVRYSKLGVDKDKVNFEEYKKTDLNTIMIQIKNIWNNLPSDKPKIIFAWSEGTLHASQLDLTKANALIFLGGISTNIKDVIYSQAKDNEELNEIEELFKQLEFMKRDEMLGLDRPVGRLKDEIALKDNWTYLQNFKKLPILFLHGENDKEVPYSQIKIWKEKLTNHNISLKTKEKGNHIFSSDENLNVEELAIIMNEWLIEVIKK